MCGRFSLTAEEQCLNAFFNLAGGKSPYVPRYNGAPTQNLAVITGDNQHELQFFRWGLIPFWSKELPRAAPRINARAEEIEQKPAFRQAIQQRRCLIPADGFYEWTRSGNKVPYRIVMKDRSLFAMAGIWEKWVAPDGENIHSFSILTTAPNELISQIHNRMPVILSPGKYSEWLNNSWEEIKSEIIVPFPSEKMEMYRVSDKVNKAGNEGPELIRPYQETGLFS